MIVEKLSGNGQKVLDIESEMNYNTDNKEYTMIEQRPTEIVIRIGDIIYFGDKQNPQEWVVEGFNPDNSLIITHKGKWKTIGFKLGEKL